MRRSGCGTIGAPFVFLDPVRTRTYIHCEVIVMSKPIVISVIATLVVIAVVMRVPQARDILTG